MATWPSTLPNPQSDGYQVKPVDQMVRTDMDSGAARQRRRTTARNDKVTLSWLFTDAQAAAFRTWFYDATTGAAGGSNWFTVTLALALGGQTSVEARFTGPCQINHIGGLQWHVTGEVEVR